MTVATSLGRGSGMQQRFPCDGCSGSVRRYVEVRARARTSAPPSIRCLVRRFLLDGTEPLRQATRIQVHSHVRSIVRACVFPGALRAIEAFLHDPRSKATREVVSRIMRDILERWDLRTASEAVSTGRILKVRRRIRCLDSRVSRLEGIGSAGPYRSVHELGRQVVLVSSRGLLWCRAALACPGT